LLVNARHLKIVPGRKTDVKDCEWIAQLLQYGLLRASFVPSPAVRQWRDLTRHRAKLIDQHTAVVNRIHKTLEDANIKLSTVISDIRGVSGRRMLRAMAGGEDDVPTLVALGNARLRATPEALQESLQGALGEHHRFLRGMVSWMGFRTVILPYEPTERIAGTSKYSLRKMVRLALDAAFSFSLAPLWIGLSVGLVFFLLACVEAIYVLSFWVRGQADALAPGWSSLMFMVLIVGGVLTTLLGFIGVYVGYIFQEAKQRPLYLLRPGPPPS